MSQIRRFAATLAADITGYSRLIGADEGGTLQRFKAIRDESIDPTIATHHGRLVKTTGDGLLVEFGSVVDSLRCATKIQAGMADRNTTVPMASASSSAWAQRRRCGGQQSVAARVVSRSALDLNEASTVPRSA